MLYFGTLKCDVRAFKGQFCATKWCFMCDSECVSADCVDMLGIIPITFAGAFGKGFLLSTILLESLSLQFLTSIRNSDVG